MRKTSDLVNEMLAEAKDAWLVAIAVGFESETKFIFSSRRYPLEELDQLVRAGGFPVGLLRFEKENSAVQGSYRPFQEYETEDWAKEYLAGLLEKTAEIIELSQEQMPRFPKAY
ncbi:hypothetical protein [Methanoregula sp.]|uniref:hypothetical protein n=1 Tax=Methanoregula sp. TaxID=2052170 RepID=UPI003563646C